MTLSRARPRCDSVAGPAALCQFCTGRTRQRAGMGVCRRARVERACAAPFSERSRCVSAGSGPSAAATAAQPLSCSAARLTTSVRRPRRPPRSSDASAAAPVAPRRLRERSSSLSDAVAEDDGRSAGSNGARSGTTSKESMAENSVSAVRRLSDRSSAKSCGCLPPVGAIIFARRGDDWRFPPPLRARRRT